MDTNEAFLRLRNLVVYREDVMALDYIAKELNDKQDALDIAKALCDELQVEIDSLNSKLDKALLAQKKKKGAKK